MFLIVKMFVKEVSIIKIVSIIIVSVMVLKIFLCFSGFKGFGICLFVWFRFLFCVVINMIRFKSIFIVVILKFKW